MADVSNIRIALKVDGDTAELTRFGTAMLAMERTTVSSLNRISTSFAGMTTAQQVLAGFGAGATALGLALAATVGPAIRFESAFAGVEKTVDGTPRQLDRIRDGLLEMSRVMPVSADGLAEIAENAGQLGVQAPQVLRFTETVAKLAASTDLTFDGASQSLARLLNVMEGGVGNIDRVGDVVTELGNNSATTESQMLSFSTRMASASRIAGLSTDEVLALAAGFSSLGIQSEAGGTAVSRVLLTMSDAVKSGGNELEIFARTSGLSAQQFADLWGTAPTEALLRFTDGLGEIERAGQSSTPVLEALSLNGIRVGNVLRVAAEGGDLLRTSLALANAQMEDGGALATEYGRRVETTAAQLEILRGRVTAVAIATGTPLLGGIVDGADAAGDAIEGLVGILTPLAGQLGTLFAQAADAVGIFYDAIGGPALGAAVAALTGLVTVTGGLLAALNSLGPAGLIMVALAIDIARVGPATALAVRGVDFLAARLFLLRTAGAQAALGMSAFSAAAVGIGTLGIAAVLVGVGLALRSAGQAAEEAGRQFEEGFVNAVDQANFELLDTQLSALNDRMNELAEQDRVADNLFGGWDSFGQAIVSVGQILTPFTENTIVNARAELAELNRLAEENGWDNYERNLNTVASAMEITRQEVLDMANGMGILEDLIVAEGREFTRLILEMQAYAAAASVATQGNQALQDKMQLGTATMQDFADHLGISVLSLGTLASGIDGVDLAKLTDETVDLGERMALLDQITLQLNTKIGDFGEALGQSAEQVLRQVGAIDLLSSSVGGLEEAMTRARSVTEQMEFQQGLLVDATNRVGEAFDGLDGSDASLQALSDAYVDLTLATAANASSSEVAAASQVALAAQFVRTASDAGFTIDRILEVGSALFDLPPTTILEIAAESVGASAAIRALQGDLDAMTREILIEAGVLDNATPGLLELLALVEAYEGSYDAELTAEAAGAIGLIAGATGYATDYRDSEYLATLEADNDPALEAIAGVVSAAQSMSDGDYVIFLLGNGVDAQTALELVETRAQVLEDDPVVLDLTATDNASPTIIAAEEELNRFMALSSNKTIEATDNASGVIGGASSNLTSFMLQEAVKRIFATDEASAPIAAASANLGGFMRQAANKVVTADSSPANAAIGSARSSLSQYTGQNASKTLTADSGQAVSAIGRAVGALAGFRSKSITLTTTHHTVYRRTSSGVSAVEDGGIFAGNQVGYYAAGGIAGRYGVHGAKVERPDRAAIYQPMTPGRLFAEPSTGGESFIPLGITKRAQAVQVWQETGRLLGQFNTGGIAGRDQPRSQLGGGAGIVTMQIPINVSVVASSGMSEERVAQIATSGIKRELAAVARDLENLVRQ